MGEVVDPAFVNVPKRQPCFFIWRIEKFKPVAVPEKEYGSFFEGDSYLVLAIKGSAGQKLESHIHFWLGSETSNDEAATAAIKAVELDDSLGGYPIQHREVQGHESKLFLSHFKTRGGISYKKGGVASGLQHVDTTFKPRLFHVKGKFTPRMQEVDIGWKAMNEGDSFILDTEDIIFVWNGSQCNRMERVKAGEYGRKLRDDRAKAKLVIMEQGKDNKAHMSPSEFKVFDTHLPASEKGQLQPASAAGADDAHERKVAASLKLWRVAEESGSLKPEQVGTAPLQRSMLDPGDCFIVDNAEAGVWVWVGSGASPKEKKFSMKHALDFVKQRNYPRTVQVTKVQQTGEPAEFKMLFYQWDKDKTPEDLQVYTENRLAKLDMSKFDAKTLHSNDKLARDTGMVDDGSGEKQIWRIERVGKEYDMVELDSKDHGQFYGGDSYVILYSYDTASRRKHIIYFWLGKKSTKDEKAAAAKYTVDLDDSMGGTPDQVRVVHGKEPNHFMAMFGGHLVIFLGGKAGMNEEKDEVVGDTYLLHISCRFPLSGKAEQVALSAESLNSTFCFVLVHKQDAYVWIGKGATIKNEKELAKTVAAKLARNVKEIKEGEETGQFWTILGGKKSYSSRVDDAGYLRNLEDHPPRLFQCSNATGKFVVDEIVDFGQQDLDPDDVFLLDAYNEVFIWVGNGARPEERTHAQITAMEYLETDPSGRDTDTPVYVVKQGFEPPTFTGFFGVWDQDLWVNQGYTSPGQGDVERITKKDVMPKGFADMEKFPYERLISKDPPACVDRTCKECHLTEAEFKKYFKMTYSEFAALPKWKQVDLRKRVKLF